MFITAVTLSIILALVSAVAGAPIVLLKGPGAAELVEHDWNANLIRFIGAAEVAGAIGLIIGIFWHPLGIAAAVGLVIVYVGGAVFHARKGDYSNPATRAGALPTVVLAIVSVAVIVTLAAA